MHSKVLLFAEVASFAIKHRHMFKSTDGMVNWLYGHFDWDNTPDNIIDAGLRLWQKHPNVATSAYLAYLTNTR